MEDIIQLDYSLLKAIHYSLRNELFDFIMPILRNRYTWIPLYLLFLILFFKKYKIRNAVLITLGLLFSVLFADYISSQIIKKNIKRARPCHIERGVEKVEALVHCGKGYSFPSSHAANHFAIAFYMIFIGFVKRKELIYTFVIWASIISFAQIYVGLHYPLDILGGAMLGIFIGFLLSSIIKKIQSGSKYFNSLLQKDSV